MAPTINGQNGVWPESDMTGDWAASWDTPVSQFLPSDTFSSNTSPNLESSNITPSTQNNTPFLPTASPPIIQDNFSTSSPTPQTQISKTKSMGSNSSSNENSPNSALSPEKTGSARVKKRTLNTLAARRYRQKRVDQMCSLESALKESEKEKDDLRMKVARLEAEVSVLRGLVKGS